MKQVIIFSILLLWTFSVNVIMNGFYRNWVLCNSEQIFHFSTMCDNNTDFIHLYKIYSFSLNLHFVFFHSSINTVNRETVWQLNNILRITQCTYNISFDGVGSTGCSIWNFTFIIPWKQNTNWRPCSHNI